jgi:hypothetical protein
MRVTRMGVFAEGKREPKQGLAQLHTRHPVQSHLHFAEFVASIPVILILINAAVDWAWFYGALVTLCKQ